MCMGGGGGGGTITMPDTGAYDRMADRQIAAMKSAQSTELTNYQTELQAAQRAQQDLIQQMSEFRTERAESVASVEAEARRMSNIIGTPPPEESAKAPVIGSARDNRKSQRLRGKRGLRIARSTASAAGEAVGLNII